jgi:hypothetical protein
LLLLFHLLQFILEAYHLSLVKDDKDDKAYGKHQHPECAQEEYCGYSGFGGLKKKHKIGLVVWILDKGLNHV